MNNQPTAKVDVVNSRFTKYVKNSNVPVVNTHLFVQQILTLADSNNVR